jgi:hypothetical protein
VTTIEYHRGETAIDIVPTVMIAADLPVHLTAKARNTIAEALDDEAKRLADLATRLVSNYPPYGQVVGAAIIACQQSIDSILNVVSHEIEGYVNGAVLQVNSASDEAKAGMAANFRSWLKRDRAKD